MKHIITLFILFSSMMVFAQPIITNASFPQVGDTLHTATIPMPSISVGTTGANQTWDFSDLDATQVIETVVFDADTSTLAQENFPSADAFINIAGGQSFFKINANNIKLLGFAGNIMGVNLAVPLNPQGNFKFAPVQYEGTYQDATGFSITMAADQLPLDSLNLPITPDSLRLTQTINTAYEADAWGTLTIPEGAHEVLRLKKIQTTNSTLEAYVNLGITAVWMPVDIALIPGLDSLGDFAQLLQGGAVESYDFLAEGIKEPIATVTMDSVGGNTATSVTFKAGGISVPVVEAGSFTQVFNASPNPAYDNVKINIDGFSKGAYELNLYNLTGKKVHSQTVNLRQGVSVILNVAHFPRGTYIYALQDKDGEIIRTNRLVVLKP